MCIQLIITSLKQKLTLGLLCNKILSFAQSIDLTYPVPKAELTLIIATKDSLKFSGEYPSEEVDTLEEDDTTHRGEQSTLYTQSLLKLIIRNGPCKNKVLFTPSATCEMFSQLTVMTIPNTDHETTFQVFIQSVLRIFQTFRDMSLQPRVNKEYVDSRIFI